MLVATYQDIYECLSFHKWKTILELKSELKEEGKRLFYPNSFIYAKFSKWENDGYISSRKRKNRDMLETALTQTEYLKVLIGVPKELRQAHGQLERELILAVTSRG